MAPNRGFLFRREEERKALEVITQMEEDYNLTGKERPTIRTIVNKLLTIRNHAIGRQKKRYLENLVEKLLDEKAAAEKEKKSAAATSTNGNSDGAGQQPDTVMTTLGEPDAATMVPSSAAIANGDLAVIDCVGELENEAVDTAARSSRHRRRKSDSTTGRRKRKRRRHESDSDSDGDQDDALSKSHANNPDDNDRYDGRLLSFAPTLISPSGPRIKDVAGMDDVLGTLLEEVMFPLQLGQVFEQVDAQPSSALLLYGPSGCGKTLLANALAAEAGVPFFSAMGTMLIGGVSGDSEANIRKLFDEAIQAAPSLVFLDHVEILAGKPDMAGGGGGSGKGSMESRMAMTLANCIDRLRSETSGGKYVMLLAATNKADSIDLEVRRRFSSEIALRMPDKTAREQILRSMTRDKRLADDVRLRDVAQATAGFVGGDLYNVVMAAQKLYIREILHAKLGSLTAGGLADETVGSKTDAQTDRLVSSLPAAAAATPSMSEQYERIRAAGLAEAEKAAARDAIGGGGGGHNRGRSDEPSAAELTGITAHHFATAASSILPAAKREGFSTVPNTTWAQVGAMDDLRRELETSIIGPIRYPEKYAAVGLKPECGILLWGPPGCGKTLVAKAVANESKANFISVRGPELVNKFVGEAERAIRELFERARTMVPCIIFFDEMDAIMAKRDASRSSDGSARIVGTLLTELDGLVDRSGLFIIGATNRPDSIDPALKRPGRFGDSIYVGPPSTDDRVAILQTLYRNAIPAEAQRATPEQLAAVARDRRCNGFSGADLAHLLRAAGKASLERLTADLVVVPASSTTTTTMTSTTSTTAATTTTTTTNGSGGLENREAGITEADWERALSIVHPSTNPADLERYKKMGQ